MLFVTPLLPRRDVRRDALATQRSRQGPRGGDDGRPQPAPGMLAQAVTPAEQLFCARQWVAGTIGGGDLQPAAKPEGAAPRSRQSRGDRLRIAYLSADFCNHPVAYSIAGLFEAHDDSRVATIGVSYAVNRDDEMSRRLRNAFGEFIDVQDKNNRDVARLLTDLRTDIAIDLTGHTRGSRSGILAFRPASVQVNYFGYSGTMGAEFIDYSGDFVSGNAWILNAGPLAFFGEHVAVANAASLHLDAHLSCARRGNFAFDDLEIGSRLGNFRRLHWC